MNQMLATLTYGSAACWALELGRRWNGVLDAGLTGTVFTAAAAGVCDPGSFDPVAGIVFPAGRNRYLRPLPLDRSSTISLPQEMCSPPPLEASRDEDMRCVFKHTRLHG